MKKNKFLNLVIIIATLLISRLEIAASTLVVRVVEMESGRILVGSKVSLYFNDSLIAVIEADKSATAKFEITQRGEYSILATNKSYLGNKVKLILDSQKDKFVSYELIKHSENVPPLLVTSKQYNLAHEEISGHEHHLEGRDLLLNLSESLASTLKSETGIAVRSMGAAPARPVLRGLGGERISIRQDAAPVIDISAGSPDHAVSIEAVNSDKIEVIRGPKSLIYANSIAGGVINVARNEIPSILKANSVNMGSIFESANMSRKMFGSGNLGLGKIFAAKADVSYSKAENISSPRQVLENTDYSTLSGALGIAGFADDINYGVSGNIFSSNYGIPGGFVGSHPNGVRIDMQKHSTSANFNMHLHNDYFDDMKIKFARSYYNHTEFESDNIVGAEFLIRNYNLLVNFIQHEIGIIKNGNLGLFAEFNSADYGGFVFTPQNETINIHAFVYEELDFDELQVTFGLRPFYSAINPTRQVQGSSALEAKYREFYSATLATSSVLQLSEQLFTGASLFYSSRPPTAEELFSSGPHLASYSYDVGNPNLDLEQGYGSEIFVRYLDDIDVAVNLFYYYFPYYIFPRNSGRINFATLLPIFETVGSQAELYGTEISYDLELNDNFEIEGNISFVVGTDLNDNSDLPMMPPAKSNLTLKYRSTNLMTGINIEAATRQIRLQEFEETTPGYLILGMFFQYFYSNDTFSANINLKANNLLNQVYYNHLSRIKGIMPEPGRNITLGLNLYL